MDRPFVLAKSVVFIVIDIIDIVQNFLAPKSLMFNCIKGQNPGNFKSFNGPHHIIYIYFQQELLVC